MNSVSMYQSGNAWQNNRYAFMSEFNKRKGIKSFGISKKSGNHYFHLITEKDRLHNFLNEPEILLEVERRVSDHKAGDKNRVFSNTVASQPCCFNLFAPLQKNLSLSSSLFSGLLGKPAIVNEIVIEFTPQTNGIYGDESIGDQSANGGTDADVAIFYTAGATKGIILIEFKYIESEFSVCGSFRDDAKAKKLRHRCLNGGFYEDLISSNLSENKGRFECGYLKYKNWQLTRDSQVFDINAIAGSAGCPFRFSGQQLWRNLLLAEQVAKQRNLDEFSFWVLAPAENTFLWNEKSSNVESEIRKVLTPEGNSVFKSLQLNKDFFQVLKPLANDEWTKNWLQKFEEKYLTDTAI